VAAVFGALLLSACAHARRGGAPEAAPAGDPVRVIIRTQGGDRISGVAQRTELRFLTDLGELVLPLRDLQMVRPSDLPGQIEVLARNGSRLSGQWREDEWLPVETGFGTANVRLRQVQELMVLSNASFADTVLWLDFDRELRLPNAPPGAFAIVPPARRATEGGLRGGVLELPDGQSGLTLPGGFGDRVFESLTVMAWICPASYPPGQQAILSSLAPETAHGGFQLAIADRRLEFEARLPGLFRVRSRAVFAESKAGEWIHVASVFDRDSMGSARLRIYVNGEPNGEARLTWQGPIFHAHQPAYIGMNCDAAQAGWGRNDSREFLGRLDDLIALDRALDDEEIREYYLRSK